jgi:hypothetical protein
VMPGPPRYRESRIRWPRRVKRAGLAQPHLNFGYAAFLDPTCRCSNCRCGRASRKAMVSTGRTRDFVVVAPLEGRAQDRPASAESVAWLHNSVFGCGCLNRVSKDRASPRRNPGGFAEVCQRDTRKCKAVPPSRPSSACDKRATQYFSLGQHTSSSCRARELTARCEEAAARLPSVDGWRTTARMRGDSKPPDRLSRLLQRPSELD